MTGSEGLWAQLRRPPGGRDARTMLGALFVDRTGTGVWAASSVLYFTFVSHLDARQIGLLLGVAGIAGIAGSPLAGRLAGRCSARRLLIGSHLLRLAAVGGLLYGHGVAMLLPFVALTALGERGAKMLEMLFATRVAGDRRTVYQALSRTTANAGYALGAGIAAAGLALGTDDAYRALALGNAVSYLLAAALVWRTAEPRAGRTTPVASSAAVLGQTAAAHPVGAGQPLGAGAVDAPRSPWRDHHYLLFVLRDIPLCLDDSVLNVGLPLWLVAHTTAPHALVPAFLAVNTVLVVVLQLRVSAAAEGPRGAVRAVLRYGAALLLTCLLLATATGGGALAASLALLAAAVLVTVAELLRSVSSWELSVLLAPERSRAAYLGVAGMSQSIQKSAGPPLLTGVVMAAGPLGWLGLGLAVAANAAVQHRACSRRLAALAALAAQPASALTAATAAAPVRRG
ncbi:MFS transporter [Streptacidiphilus jiangxiensis]|uniref:Major Facilitator Superfamily protein n=1 Tax=Streptacidiphilus jiangxiensis TaxID=235985 RepID=A0A1H7PS07_STRJI|nr:MFS transporter [Streptacidiphilus jiangxiensis]SEL38174.1 Major Facilitator Superfamily protein [Streptacidiphilus jiangxiensis]